jgi:hypothetical protein
MIRVLDAGDALDQKAGRKFGYTEQDFLEAYFGKDNARAARVTLDEESSIFGFNDSYKRKYPIDKYQKLPELEAKKRLMEERSMFSLDSFKGEGKEYSQQFLESLDVDRAEQFKDVHHPTDKGRTLLKDIESRMENYEARKRKTTGFDVIDTRDVGHMRTQLREEYFPKPKKVDAVPGSDVAAAADVK